MIGRREGDVALLLHLVVEVFDVSQDGHSQLLFDVVLTIFGSS